MHWCRSAVHEHWETKQKVEIFVGWREFQTPLQSTAQLLKWKIAVRGRHWKKARTQCRFSFPSEVSSCVFFLLFSSLPPPPQSVCLYALLVLKNNRRTVCVLYANGCFFVTAHTLVNLFTDWHLNFGLVNEHSKKSYWQWGRKQKILYVTLSTH